MRISPVFLKPLNTIRSYLPLSKCAPDRPAANAAPKGLYPDRSVQLQTMQNNTHTNFPKPVIFNNADASRDTVERLASNLQNIINEYNGKLPEFFSGRQFKACILPDRYFRERCAITHTESDPFKPPEESYNIVPPAVYELLPDIICFSESMADLKTLEPWHKACIAHELLHAASSDTTGGQLRSGIDRIDAHGENTSISPLMNEGLTEHIRMLLGGEAVENRYYIAARAFNIIAARTGEEPVLAAFFKGDIDALRIAVDREYGAGAYSYLDSLVWSVNAGEYMSDERLIRFSNLGFDSLVMRDWKCGQDGPHDYPRTLTQKQAEEIMPADIARIIAQKKVSVDTNLNYSNLKTISRIILYGTESDGLPVSNMMLLGLSRISDKDGLSRTLSIKYGHDPKTARIMISEQDESAPKYTGIGIKSMFSVGTLPLSQRHTGAVNR